LKSLDETKTYLAEYLTEQARKILPISNILDRSKSFQELVTLGCDESILTLQIFDLVGIPKSKTPNWEMFMPVGKRQFSTYMKRIRKDAIDINMLIVRGGLEFAPAELTRGIEALPDLLCQYRGLICYLRAVTDGRSTAGPKGFDTQTLTEIIVHVNERTGSIRTPQVIDLISAVTSKTIDERVYRRFAARILKKSDQPEIGPSGQYRHK
jgi:hypothetical protein